MHNLVVDTNCKYAPGNDANHVRFQQNNHLQSDTVVCRARTRAQQKHTTSPTFLFTHHLSPVDSMIYPGLPHDRRTS